jgi:large subunit ribosomal protein L17
MKHRHSNRILGRVASSREQLLRNLSRSLLIHGSITTTEAKAKELRRFFEPLIRRAQHEPTVIQRRSLQRSMPVPGDVERLLTAAQRMKDRRGGYIRLTKLVTRRADGAAMVRIDMLNDDQSV